MKDKVIGIIGLGKLGKEIYKLAKEKNYKIKTFSSKSHALIDDETVENLNIKEANTCDLLIDASSAPFEYISHITKPLIIANTQINEEDLKNLKCKHIYIPNGSFSWGAIKECAIKLAQSKNYQFLINDIHHAQKKDAPSGTASSLINEIKKTGSQVDVGCARGGEIVGVHSVYAFNKDEFIKIEHQVLNRSIFAQGILMQAENELK